MAAQRQFVFFGFGFTDLDFLGFFNEAKRQFQFDVRHFAIMALSNEAEESMRRIEMRTMGIHEKIPHCILFVVANAEAVIVLSAMALL